MVTTVIRDPAPADGAGRFRRTPTPAARPRAARAERPRRSLADAVRAGEYAVDADAVAAALLDRLRTGRSGSPQCSKPRQPAAPCGAPRQSSAGEPRSTSPIQVSGAAASAAARSRGATQTHSS
jgi:hypothetical protein